MQIAFERLRPLLARVQKPARYVGGEWNSQVKDWSAARVRLVLAFPEVYEIGMSNLGLAILYERVNARDDLLAERAYAPWADMEEALRAEGLPLFSIESRRPLASFDVLGLSLQHELNYTNVLNMLDLAGLPIAAAERTADQPLVIAGGSCAHNPEPLAPFIDAFVIGDGEEALLELLDAVAAWKEGSERDRGALLRALAGIEGVYVPALYAPRRDARGTPLAEPMDGCAPRRVQRRIVSELGPPPLRPIVPTMQAVHDRATVEIQRGCGRGCRFCQAGIIYRPVRLRSEDEALAALDEILAHTGYSEAAFVSLSASDHPCIASLVARALARYGPRGLAVSLPSLRIDTFSVQLAAEIQATRKTGLTFAPEAGSQRLRDVINKGVSEEDLLRTTAAAFESGWNRLKLYFMLGLPTETDNDVLEIARLVQTIHQQGRRLRGRHVDLAVSVATFVPKPHSAFQWAALAPREVVERRQELLRQRARGRGIRLSWSAWDETWLEALLSRGDRRLAPVIARAWRAGARFDAWSERFRPDLWQRALAEEGLEPDELLREREADEALPWEVIDTGVRREYLWREYRRALEGRPSPDCFAACAACGPWVEQHCHELPPRQRAPSPPGERRQP